MPRHAHVCAPFFLRWPLSKRLRGAAGMGQIEESRRLAYENAKDIIACGFDPKVRRRPCILRKLPP